MKKRHKAYLRLNIIPLIFIVISFISITFAWFAYSGLSKVSTEIGVKAWYIELQKDGKPVSNDIVISLSEIYPGMDTITETVNIKNLGDSDAQIKYSIVSARILGNDVDNYVVNSTTTSEYVEDSIAHNYPFHVNINLNKNYAMAKTGESVFEVSVSWPLDSDTDELDSLWGTEAYKFQQNEQKLKDNDSNYQVRPSIQIVISVTAEQYLETDTSSDTKFNLGDQVLYDPISNKSCSSIGDNCIKTYVIDTNNKLGDNSVTLLTDPINTFATSSFNNYDSLYSSITSSWSSNNRPLNVEDLLKPISKDVVNSYLVRDNFSNNIIGYLNTDDRISNEISKVITYNGYYSFLNEKFDYLLTNNCYWLYNEYNTTNAFAVKKIDETSSKIYGENKVSNCKIIPIIIADKINIK